MVRPPDRNDIAFHIMETDSTYFQLIVPTSLSWVVLHQAQDSSSANIWITSSNTIFLSLEDKTSAKAGSSFGGCLAFTGQPTIHYGIVTAEFSCNGCTILDGPEDWFWAYEENGIVFSGPMRGLKAQGTEDIRADTDAQWVKRSTAYASENTAGSQPPSSSSTTMPPWMAKINKLIKIRTAHGAIMSIVFVLLFPTFASLIHLLPPSNPVVKIHASLQAMSAALTISGFGLGIYLTREIPTKGKYHQVIGAIVVVLLVIVQPVIGILQHRVFRRTQRKTWGAYAHRWLGRSMLVLGVINGGLGRHLSGSTSSGGSRGALVAYGVVAGVVYALYIAIVSFATFRRRQASRADKTEPREVSGNANASEYPLTEVPAVNTLSTNPQV